MAHRLVVVSAEERKRIAGLARKPRCRHSEYSPGRPCDWRPHLTDSHIDPTYRFTPAGAWEFIAAHLEAGGDLYLTELKRPKGRYAYVIFIPPAPTWRGVYIKFELTHPGIYGRSFHHPEHPALENVTV
jgi:hypothetical protein